MTETNDIVWEVTNVLLDNNMTVRKGDAVLFVAKPVNATNGSMVIRIVGVGAVRNTSAVRWGVAGGIVWAWVLTIPCSAVVAALAWWIGTLVL